MSEERAAVARSTVVQVVARVAGLALSLASAAYLTRTLGVATYGRLALVGALVAMAGTLADGGFGLVLGRELSRAPRAPNLLGSVLRGRCVIALPVAAVAAALGALAYSGQRGDLATGLSLGMLQLLPAAVTGTLAAGYQAELRLGTFALVELAARVLQVGGSVLVAAQGGRLLPLVLVGLGAAAVQAGLSLRLLRWPEPLSAPVDWARFAGVARLSAALGVAVVLNTLYGRFDAVLLSFLRSADEVGRYLLAYRVLEMAQLFPSLFGLAVLPLLTRAAEDSPRMLAATVRATRVVTLVMLPAAVLIFVLASPLVRALGGSGFAGAAPSLRGLAVAMLASGYNILLGLAVIALDGQRRALWLNVGGLVLNAGLNVALVPTYGAPAAAWATSASDTALTIGLLVVLRGHLRRAPSLGGLAGLLPAAAAAGTAAWLLRGQTLVIPVLAAAIAYVAVGLASRQIRREDVAELRQALAGGRRGSVPVS